MIINSSKTYPTPIWKQLVTDVPFAWHQRNEAAQGLQFTLPDLIRTDQTLNAYIDALRIAKQVGACLHEDLNFEDWGAVFIGAVLGLMFEDNKLLETALAAINEDIDRSEELEHAIRWPLAHAASQRIAQWQEHENPAIRCAVFGALYADANPKTLRNKPQYLHIETHPVVLTRILDIVGNQRHITWNDDIAKLYDAELIEVRFHAIRAGILLGDVKEGEKTYKNVYYGRGYVQLTWESNIGKAFNEPLHTHPENAMKWAKFPIILFSLLTISCTDTSSQKTGLELPTYSYYY